MTNSPSLRLSGKVCVITGTGGSIGRAAAVVFAREGASVVGCDGNVAAAEATAEMVRAEGEPRCGREHGVPERPLELQDAWLTGAYDGQGRDHRYDAATRDGRARARYSREFHLPWLDRNQSDARTAEGPRMGDHDARQD